MKSSRLNLSLKKLEQDSFQDREIAKKLIHKYIRKTIVPRLHKKADSLHEFEEAYAIGYKNLLLARDYPVCVMQARRPEGYTWTIFVNSLYKLRNNRDTRRDRSELYEAYLLSQEKMRIATSSNRTPLGNKDFMRLLNKALGRIPKQQAVAFTLRHVKGFKVMEVAHKMNISIYTVKEYLKNSKKSLREVLPPEGDIDNDYLE